MLFGEPKTGLTFAGSAYQMNDVENDPRNEDMSFAGRGTINFAELMGNKEAILHVGVAGYNNSWSIRPTSSTKSGGGTTTSGSILSYRTPGRGLNNIFRAQINGEAVGTAQGAPSDITAEVDSKAYGLEGIAAYKSFKFQGEYTAGDYKGTYQDSQGIVTLDNKAYYGEVLWLLTGENYSSAYKKGTFSSIKPLKDFDLENFSGLGAVEFGLRYEGYDVKNANISGTAASATLNGSRFQGTHSCDSSGRTSGGAAAHSASEGSSFSGCKSGAHTLTAGLKWILNPNVMVKAAYSRTTYDSAWTHYDIGSSGANANFMKYEDMFSLRTQYAF